MHLYSCFNFITRCPSQLAHTSTNLKTLKLTQTGKPLVSSSFGMVASVTLDLVTSLWLLAYARLTKALGVNR